MDFYFIFKESSYIFIYSHVFYLFNYLLKFSTFYCGKVLFCAVLLLVLALYRAGTPPRAMPRRTLRFAALLTALAMAVCSGVFSWFIGMSSRYALVYGSLASLIILLVWLYLCGNILLLGAAVSRTWVIRRTR